MTQSERTELRKMVADNFDIQNLTIENLKIDTDISDLKVDLENEENIDKVVLTFIEKQDFTQERMSQDKLNRFYLEA